MATRAEAKGLLLEEIDGDAADVREMFRKHFPAVVETFVGHMTSAFVAWDSFDRRLKGDERLSLVSALVYTSISLHVQSMKLFLSGHIVAAGNLTRQVVESIALALLCSNKQHDVLDRFMANKYSTSHAVADLRRRFKQLQLHPDAVEALEIAQDFYHRYSHPTILTLASTTEFGDASRLFIGASFDELKIDSYETEIASRLSLAEHFESFVSAVLANLAAW
jgi:hypothetical protein